MSKPMKNAPTGRKRVIAVIGGAEADEQALRDAEAIGAGIARRKAILLCGGMGGVMEAACRGAKRAGGTTIGILPGTEKSDANDHVDMRVVTGLGPARNIIIARSCDVAIAVAGKYGTLSEIAYCLMLRVPVVGLGTWHLPSDPNGADVPIQHAKDVSDVLVQLDKLLNR